MTKANFFRVRESDKAFGLVAAADVKTHDVGILWLPKSKVVSVAETDQLSPYIHTNKGRFYGTPLKVEIDPDFATKLGLA